VLRSIKKTNGKEEVVPFVSYSFIYTAPITQEEIITSLKKVCHVYTKSLLVLKNIKY